MSEQKKVVGRRSLLQLAGVGIGISVGAGMLAACSNKGGGGGESSSSGGGATGAAPMDCKSPLDDNSKNLRRTLQYKAKAEPPEKNCAACAQYQVGLYGECGGCKLIPGPVRAEGGCLSFAPKGAEGGAAPAASKPG